MYYCFLPEKQCPQTCNKFNGDYYIQTQGTAMGTRMAPAYANIFMYTMEEKIIEQLPEIVF